MTTPLSTKFAALAVALMINVTLIGAVAYLFNGQLHQSAPVMAVAGSQEPTAFAGAA